LQDYEKNPVKANFLLGKLALKNLKARQARNDKNFE